MQRLSTGQPVSKSRPMIRADLCLEFVNTRYWRGQADADGDPELRPRISRSGRRPMSVRRRPGRWPAPEFDRAHRVARDDPSRCSTPTAQGKAPAGPGHRGFEPGLAAAPPARPCGAAATAIGWDVDLAGQERRWPCWRRCCGRPATCWPAPRLDRGPPLRQSRMRLGLPRRQPRRQAPLVLDVRVAATAPRRSGTITRAARASGLVMSRDAREDGRSFAPPPFR